MGLLQTLAAVDCSYCATDIPNYKGPDNPDGLPEGYYHQPDGVTNVLCAAQNIWNGYMIDKALGRVTT